MRSIREGDLVIFFNSVLSYALLEMFSIQEPQSWKELNECRHAFQGISPQNKHSQGIYADPKWTESAATLIQALANTSSPRYLCMCKGQHFVIIHGGIDGGGR